MGGPRPSWRWRAEGHRLEVTVSRDGPPCSQQGGCVLGFHMSLRKRGTELRGGGPPRRSRSHGLKAWPGVPAARSSLWQALIFIFLILHRIRQALLASCAHGSSQSYYKDEIVITSGHRRGSEGHRAGMSHDLPQQTPSPTCQLLPLARHTKVTPRNASPPCSCLATAPISAGI